MSQRIASFDEFRAAKRVFLDRYERSLLMPTSAERAAMLKAAEPMARFSKLSPDQLLRNLAKLHATT